MNLQNICDGDLEELKQIPKIKFTEAFSKQILVKMERNIQDLQIKYQSVTDTEMEFSSCCLLEKIKRIENCILYIKKIK